MRALLPGQEGGLVEVPLYRSHKIVAALEIADVEMRPDGRATLAFADPRFGRLTVEAKVVHRYSPIRGDRLVIFADGYRSISPRQAFIDGYEPI